MAELRVHVHEMDCAEEAALVRRALASTPGISQIEFDLIHGVADIVFDERVVDEDAILRAVRSTGLQAHPLSVEHADGVAARPPADGHAADAHVTTIAIAVSGALFILGWVLEGVSADRWIELIVHREGEGHDARASVAYALSAAAGLWPMLPRALAAVRHRRLDMHALVCLTVFGAAAVGEWSEGAAVAVLFGLAHWMEGWSIGRARAEIAALMGRGPTMIAEGAGAVGPEAARWAASGVSAAPTERWIERFASIYTPVVLASAVIVAVVPPLIDGGWATWFYRGLFFLVLACPCALVISTPVTMVAALSAAARSGVLVKGAAVLERAAGAAAPTRQGLADTGIVVARAQGGDLARADVVVTAPDEQAVAAFVRHARRAMRVVRQNVAIALATKVAFLVAAPFGFAPLWMAVLADTGATVIVTLNGLRMLRT